MYDLELPYRFFLFFDLEKNMDYLIYHFFIHLFFGLKKALLPL